MQNTSDPAGRNERDLFFMAQAIEAAQQAAAQGEVPIGAVVVIDDVVVACRHNEREQTGDPTAHAEILALRDAALKQKSANTNADSSTNANWRLEGATMYVTLEPCAMCAGALVNARIGRVVFGARNMEAGACGSLYNLGADPRLNHEFALTSDVCADQCGQLLTEFFSSRR